MRVNVDEQAISEPRIKRMARRLQRPHYEVLGRLLPVWMLCYQRRSAIVDAIDIDIAADLDGFAETMVAEEMASIDDGGIYVHGVTDRIEFLERQVEKGRKSGEVRRAKSKGSTAQRTDVQPGFKSGSNHTGTNGRTSVERRFDSGRTKSGTYSPDLDLDQAPDQALKDHRVPAEDANDHPGETSGDVGDVLSQGDLEPGSERGAVGTEKGSPPRSHASTARNERPPPDPPVPALTTASVLMDYLLRNHPNSKLARCSENERENTLLRWANDVRLIHELDRREYGAIQAMIHWCQRDSFWSTVILSAGNLRDKFDKMDAQRKRPRGANGKADVTPEEVNARRAREQRTEADLRRSENERAARSAADRGEVQAMIASVAKRGIGAAGSAEPTEPLDDEPESREDEPDAG